MEEQTVEKSKSTVNILKLQEQVVDEYRSYVESYLDIQDADLRKKTESLLADGHLWPEPYLQCNPAFEKGETVSELVRNQTFHPNMEKVFTGYELYKHQAEAMKRGAKDQGFIVTSGTGSGKSLTFLGTIINGVLQKGYSAKSGVRAIIVYPMNALINSQKEELESLEEKFLEQNPGEDFPITYKMYTGQENPQDRQKALENPPHIILTNYMMLELLMTRSREKELRESIFQNLEYLVFDELHWYRGRQGADVAMLIRRIKASTQKPLVCIGTSATLSSGTWRQQQKDVSFLGKQLFDEDFDEEQIIGEDLRHSISAKGPNRMELEKALNEPIDKTGDVAYLLNHPLAAWIEHKVAIKNEGEKRLRGAPATIAEICDKLYQDAGLTLPRKEGLQHCRNKLDELLQLLQHVNQGIKDQILPFRIHQFVAQTATLKVTLQKPGERQIEAVEESSVFKNGVKMPLVPVYFNRQSGFTYLGVNLVDGEVEPWEIDDDNDENIGGEKGYFIWDYEGESAWSDNKRNTLLPQSWFSPKLGELRADKKNLVPRKMYVTPGGTISDDPLKVGAPVWFIRSPLKIDPFSGIVYDGGTSENTKLAQPGDAGRSISTSILSYSVLRQLQRQEAPELIQKIMSFTDNRQDAALQAGHFNDFIQQVYLRASIYKALKRKGELSYSNIAGEVFQEMRLTQKDYAKEPSDNPRRMRENESAFKKWLSYQIFIDLRRSWRHRLPNLEQCGLLQIGYHGLKEECEIAENWKGSEILSRLKPEDRYGFLIQLLNFIRTNYAISHPLLRQKAIEETQEIMSNKLSEAWVFEGSQPLSEANWMQVRKPKEKKRKKVQVQSMGASSALGTYIKFVVKEHGLDMNHQQLEQEIENILYCLDDHKAIKKKDGEGLEDVGGTGYIRKSLDFGPEPLYQLNIDCIVWQLGDGKTVVLDEVRLRSMKERKAPINAYFSELYQQDPLSLKKLTASEHTGQINAEQRKIRENQFKDARLKALYCSPTMELGIDISELSVVHMRNVPPSPANYAQRSGRAGRKGQGALVLTFCGKKSPHDRHFFKKRLDMIAGKVSPQQLDLTNPDLIKSHLQASYLASCQLTGMKKSLDALVNIEAEKMPILDETWHQLNAPQEHLDRQVAYFHKVIAGLTTQLEEKDWYTPNWVQDQLQKVPFEFDRACVRWRQMYSDAVISRENASREMKRHDLSKSSEEWKAAHVDFLRAQRKIDLLRNQGGKKDYSEFYPYRYFASEGFLPGYNFTRLPIRIFLNDQAGGGDYVSRPRLLAISEFGPENTIYHLGRKWKVTQMQIPPDQNGFSTFTAQVDPQTEYFTKGSTAQASIDVLGGNPKQQDSVPSLFEMQEMMASPYNRISCLEDERVRQRFAVKTFFTYNGDLTRTKHLEISHAGDVLLNLHWLPAAEVRRVIAKKKEKDCFHINKRTGFWKSGQKLKEAKELAKKNQVDELQELKLTTSVVTDCVYIQPLSNLTFGTLVKQQSGAVTLAFALKKAIEEHFRADPQELALEVTGHEGKPNILLFENAEGSLGVLSRLFKDESAIRNVLEKAVEVCNFHENGTEPATYSDILSYYNQRYHKKINRFAIQETLQTLLKSDFSLKLSNGYQSYQHQYNSMAERLNPHDELGNAFLQFLQQNKLILPIEVDYQPKGCRIRLDFYLPGGIGIQLRQDYSPGKQSGERELKNQGIQLFKKAEEQNIESFVTGLPAVFRPFQS